MLVNKHNIVDISEASQNFSKVVQLVENSGVAGILKNGSPKYAVVSFAEYEELQSYKNLWEMRAK
ncbi:MAG: hypothetical protein BEN18_09680 [Epulopiscium sp. Nuni2H_MBin001]|nr:MAG: hypothetical protein BEN18_09680 [Epulopiscium sp. Nuni2H_MBin001]